MINESFPAILDSYYNYLPFELYKVQNTQIRRDSTATIENAANTTITSLQALETQARAF